MNEQMRTPKQILAQYMTVCEGKVTSPVWRTLLLGVLAGAFISIGAVGSCVSMYGINGVGVSRTLGAAVFPIGLMLIVLIGGELFTGNCLLITGVLDRRYKAVAAVKNLVLVYISNLAGALLMSFLTAHCGEWGFSDNTLGAYVVKTAVGKVNIDFTTAFISGILCNILVCAAVYMALGAKDMSGKILAIFFPIFVFVICGFEHCVANMYFVSAGILASDNADYVAKAVELYGYTKEQLSALNWQNMFLVNLLPVTLGNILGGMVGIGLPVWALYHEKK